MKKIIFSIIFLVVILLTSKFVGQVLGQETTTTGGTTTPEQMAQQNYGITFPVAELGNCNTVAACKQFCEQSVNRDVCSKFAAEHQLGQPPTPPTSINKEQILTDAKQFLGCSSYDTCRAFCSDPTNRQKCQEFSQREGFNHSPMMTKITSLTTLLFQAAKKELGCDSEVTCQAFCDQTTNYQKCTMFAVRHQLISVPGTTIRPVNPTLGPTASPSGLPCNSIQSCYLYCSNNPSICPPQIMDYLKQQKVNLPQQLYPPTTTPPR